jgi:hypothetical protein
VIVWNNGDDSDLDDGGAGTNETLIVTATADDRPDRQVLRSYEGGRPPDVCCTVPQKGSLSSRELGQATSDLLIPRCRGMPGLGTALGSVLRRRGRRSPTPLSAQPSQILVVDLQGRVLDRERVRAGAQDRDLVAKRHDLARHAPLRIA